MIMPNKHNSAMEPDQPLIYQIRLRGHLDRRWTGWFEGMTIQLDDTGETLLTGSVVDQAALHGLLKKVRDVGLPLLSVNYITPEQAEESDSSGMDQEHSIQE
jgi:hypothetical protein